MRKLEKGCGFAHKLRILERARDKAGFGGKCRDNGWLSGGGKVFSGEN